MTTINEPPGDRLDRIEGRLGQLERRSHETCRMSAFFLFLVCLGAVLAGLILFNLAVRLAAS